MKCEKEDGCLRDISSPPGDCVLFCFLRITVTVSCCIGYVNYEVYITAAGWLSLASTGTSTERDAADMEDVLKISPKM